MFSLLIIFSLGTWTYLATFRPLFPHAKSHNIRLVSVNDREYSGSSAFSEGEMNDILSNDPQRQAKWLREQGIHFATFIARFIETHNIPPPKHVDGKDVGGVCFLAWSLGVTTLFSLLANLSLLDSHTTSILERYVRTMVIHGKHFSYGCIYSLSHMQPRSP
jgi:hypothetical protein